MNFRAFENDKKKNQNNTDFNNILHGNINRFSNIGQGVVRRPRPEPRIFWFDSFFGLPVFFADARGIGIHLLSQLFQRLANDCGCAIYSHCRPGY